MRGPTTIKEMKTAFLSILLALAAATASAQTTSTLFGQVQDPRGGALAGVAVTARHLESGLTRAATSDAVGGFVLAGIQSG